MLLVMNAFTVFTKDMLIHLNAVQITHIDFLRGQFDSKNHCNWIDGLIGLKRLHVNTSINLLI